MSRRGVFAALALLAFFFGLRTLARQVANEQTLDSRIAAALDRHPIPGAVAVVVTRSRTVYRAAFGVADFSSRRPMTRDAIFRIASMTKPVTSVAAMQRVERGQITLDDPAAKYLPELKALSVFQSFNSATGAYTLRRA